MGPGPGAGGPWVVCVGNSCCDTDSYLRLPHLYTPPVRRTRRRPRGGLNSKCCDARIGCPARLPTASCDG
eukprot:4503810-Prymnesium_polylepis.1